jgi:hypothetical protein
MSVILRPPALLDDLRLDRDLPRRTAMLVATTIFFGAIYGADPRIVARRTARALRRDQSPAADAFDGCDHRALQNWIVASILGLPMRLRQTFALTLVPLAIVSIVAASLAPVAWFFTTALPDPSPTQRTLHNLLYLVHTMLIAAGGIEGTSMP